MSMEQGGISEIIQNSQENTSQSLSDTVANDSSSDDENSSCDILKCQVLNKEFLLTYTKHNHLNIGLKIKNNSKILKLSTEWSYEEVIREVAKLERSIFKNLFIFIFELDDIKILEPRTPKRLKLSTKNIETLIKILLKFVENRPLVLQLTSNSEKATKFFYKDDIDGKFRRIKKQPGNKECIIDFESFFWTLMDENIEIKDFECALLQKLPSIKNSTLVLRCLKILQLSDDFFNRLLLKCGSFATKIELVAALDCKFENEIEIEESASSLCLKVTYEPESNDTFEEESVLSNALEHSNHEVVNFLITNCSHLIKDLPFDHQQEISTKALELNHLELLCNLIECCDFAFPEDFDLSTVNYERLRKIAEKRKELHDAIIKEEITKIDEFITSNPTIKRAFNVNNDSAMYHALDSKKYKIFYHLKTSGYQALEFDDIKDHIEDKNEVLKAEKFAAIQRQKNVQEAQPIQQKPVMLIIARSRIHNKNLSTQIKAEYDKKIRKWFEEVYDIKEVKPIVDVAVKCVKLMLIFDFESDSTTYIDLVHSAEGLTYTNTGLIMIGSKYFGAENREQKIKGVIVHELCHYVMGMVYENDEFPFFKEDYETRKLYMDILNDINKWSPNGPNEPDDECNGVMSVTFRGYPPKDHPAELIVRVVHLLAEFGNDAEKIGYLDQKYRPLFDFHRHRVVQDLVNFLTSDRENIRKLNKKFGILTEIQKLAYEYTEVKDISFLTEQQFTVFNTNQPKLLFIYIFKNLSLKYGNLVNARNIFVSLKNYNNSSELRETIMKNSNLNIFVHCPEGQTGDIKHIQSNQKVQTIFVVSNEHDKEKVSEGIDSTKCSILFDTINIYWKNLSKDSQNKILETNIKIRNHQIQYSKLIQKSDEINTTEKQKLIDQQSQEEFSPNFDLLLSTLVNQSGINVNTDFDLQKIDKDLRSTFIPRMFRRKIKIDENLLPLGDHKIGNDYKLDDISEEELIEDVQNKKYVLLSDLAGSGKSWVMQNIAMNLDKKYPSRWISQVDLKEFIKTFKHENASSIQFSNFMLEKILKLNDKFKAETFLSMYKIGQVSILFDGFDEIAPDCAEFVTKLALSFEFNGGNQLWIATRDYFENDLQNKLGINNVYNLKPLSEANEVDLIASSMILEDLGEKAYNHSRKDLDEFIKKSPNFKAYYDKAQILNRKIIDLKNSSIGIPQFYKIIVEVLRGNKNEAIGFTITKFYSSFVDIQYKVWSNKKGDLRKRANLKIQNDYIINFIELHILHAMRGIYSEIESFYNLEFDPTDWPETEIIGCGFLTKKGENLFFIHETFREYFAAQYIRRNILKGGFNEEFCRFFMDFLATSKYGVIRVFLNDVLAEDVIRKKTEQNIPKMSKHFYNFVSKLDSLSEIFENNQKNLINLIENFFKLGIYDDIKNILFNSIEAIFMAAIRNENCLQLLEFLSTFLNTKDLKTLLLKKNQHKSNFLYLMFISNKSFGIETTLEFIKQKLSCADYEQVLKSKSFNERNLLQVAATSVKDLNTHKLLWKIFRNFFDSDKAFVDYLQEVDAQVSNVFHIAACFAPKEIFNFIIEELEKIECFEGTKRILSNFGLSNRNFLQIAAMRNKSVDLHKNLLIVIKKYFTISEISQMLKHRDDNGCISLFLVARWNTKEVLEFVWNYVIESEEIISKSELLELLQKSDDSGKTIFHLCVQGNDEKKLKFLWIEIENFFKINGSIEKFREILMQKTIYNGGTILHETAVCESIEFHEAIWDMLFEYFKDINELIEFILLKNSDDNIFLHDIVSSGKTNILQKVIGILKKHFSESYFQKIINSKGFSGRNLLQAAAMKLKDFNTQKYLWQIFKDLCNSYQDFFNFLLELDIQKNNVFFLAAGFSSSEIFEFMIEELSKIVSPEEIRMILRSIGFHKISILQFAAFQNESLNFHKTLWKIMRNYFNETALLDMVNYCDELGENILHTSVSSNTLEINEFIWENIKSLMTNPVDQKEYLGRKNVKKLDLNQMAINGLIKNDEVKKWIESLCMWESSIDK